MATMNTGTAPQAAPTTAQALAAHQERLALMRAVRYVDVRIAAGVRAGQVYHASVLCTRVDADGTKRKDWMLWHDTSRWAECLAKRARAAMAEVLARGHTARI